jgi:hypothetical protein
MAKVTRLTGLGLESLYKALSGSGNPELATVLRVKALGLELAAKSMSRPALAKAAKPKEVKRVSAPGGGLTARNH